MSTKGFPLKFTLEHVVQLEVFRVCQAARPRARSGGGKAGATEF